MTKYNYYEAVREDAKEAILELKNYTDFSTYDESDLYSYLYDELFINDSVTGNASGSYFCNAYRAEEALAHNLGLFGEALLCFGDDGSYLEKGAEACDVTIRCYVLGEVLGDIVSDFIAGNLD